MNNSSGDLIFIFSCPVNVGSILVGEYDALLFLLEKFGCSAWGTTKLILFSDSQILVNLIQAYNFVRHQQWPLDERFYSMAKRVKCEVKKISTKESGTMEFKPN